MTAREWTAFLILTLIWGASFLWIKIAVQDIGPYTLVALRLTFGLIGLAGFLAVLRPEMPRDPRIWRALAVLGILNAALPWLLISWAEQSIDSALATVLNSTVPLFTILIAHYALHDDRMTVPRVIGLLVGFAGVLALIQRGGGITAILHPSGERIALAGQAAMLMASASYAISGVYARRKLRHVSPLVQAFFSMLVATALMWAVLPIAHPAVSFPSAWITWIAILWLGVLGAGIASFLFLWLLHSIGPTRSSLVTYTIPLVGVTLGVVILHEALDVYLVTGTALILSGLWVVNR